MSLLVLGAVPDECPHSLQPLNGVDLSHDIE